MSSGLPGVDMPLEDAMVAAKDELTEELLMSLEPRDILRRSAMVAEGSIGIEDTMGDW